MDVGGGFALVFMFSVEDVRSISVSPYQSLPGIVPFVLGSISLLMVGAIFGQRDCRLLSQSIIWPLSCVGR